MQYYILGILFLAGCDPQMDREIVTPKFILSYQQNNETLLYQKNALAAKNMDKFLEKLDQHCVDGRIHNHVYFPTKKTAKTTKRLEYIKKELLKKGYTDKQFFADSALQADSQTINIKINQYKVQIPKNNKLGESLLQNKLYMIDDLSLLFENNLRPQTSSAVNIASIEKYESGIQGAESSKGTKDAGGFGDTLKNASENILGGILGQAK
jgi:hypothetical protein